MRRAPPLLTGVVAGGLKAIYTLLPFFLLLDLGLFGVVGLVVGRGRPTDWWSAAVTASLPAMVVVGWELSGIGLASLAAGVGLGHLLSLVLIPASALAGAAVGARRPPGPGSQP